MKIVQIEESEVIKNICDNANVFRLKVDDCSICNLQDKSIKTINRDMQKEDVHYLYFVLVEEQDNKTIGEGRCSHNWESEWNELRNQMECKEAKHHEEVNVLKHRIAELERYLMIYKQKYSAIVEMIFGE